jgi:hypothetical protein
MARSVRRGSRVATREAEPIRERALARVEGNEGELTGLLGQIERGGEVPEIGATEVPCGEDTLNLWSQGTSREHPADTMEQLVAPFDSLTRHRGAHLGFEQVG